MKVADGMANNEDADQTAPQAAALPLKLVFSIDTLFKSYQNWSIDEL